MLRWSSETTGLPLDMRGLADRAVDVGVEGSSELLELVDRTLDRAADPAEARVALTGRLGTAATVRAASVIGNFEMMNRLADGIGVPVGRVTIEREASTLESLGLDRIAH
jgi:hypothetical protein